MPDMERLYQEYARQVYINTYSVFAIMNKPLKNWCRRPFTAPLMWIIPSNSIRYFNGFLGTVDVMIGIKNIFIVTELLLVITSWSARQLMKSEIRSYRAEICL